jgi:hypothetical protein
MWISLSLQLAEAALTPAQILNSAEGAIIQDRGSDERLVFACAKKTEDGQCLSYRFFSLVGRTGVEVLGDQDLKIGELKPETIGDRHQFFEDRWALPILSWIGRGFRAFYTKDGRYDPELIAEWGSPGEDLYLPSIFMPLPVIGILGGIGNIVIAVGIAYDTPRFLLLAPFELGKNIITTLHQKKINRAFQAMFDSRKYGNTLKLRSPRFHELKRELVRLSSTVIEASPTP